MYVKICDATIFLRKNPSKNCLVAPRNKVPIIKVSRVIYRFKSHRVECDEKHIGESLKTFGETFKENLKHSCPIYDHSNTTGHITTVNNFHIIWREDHILTQTIKESIYIKVNNPSLNENIGKSNLPYIWDEVLFNTLDSNLK